MQEFVNEILKKCLAPRDVAIKLINTLFYVNSIIPEEAKNKRPSLTVFRDVKRWGGTVECAFIAALSSLNSMHGCFGDSFRMIEVYLNDNTKNKELFGAYIKGIIAQGKAIPGFGSPIFKGRDASDFDIRCATIKKALFEEFPVLSQEIDNLKDFVRKTIGNEDIDANIVFFNSLTMLTLGYSKDYASLIFILASQVKYLNEIN